jgi:cytochrome c556
MFRRTAALERNSRDPGRRIVRALLCAGLVVGSPAPSLIARAQDTDAAVTEDVIFARKSLMDFMCERMAQIETMIGRGHVDLKFAQASGEAISAMLLAFPHLFPPGSNRWHLDPDADPATETLASPDLWTRFSDFDQQAAAASKSAHELSRAATTEEVKSRARELRILCDSCHALYLEDP